MKTLRNCLGITLLSSLAVLPVMGAETMEVNDAKLQSYRMVLKGFGGSLQTALKAGMKAGGPVNAIDVCHSKAASIAAEHAEKSGIEIGRTSLKVRNANNAPDDWEKRILEQFEARKAEGADPKTLEHAEMVKHEDGTQEIRYMKAIPTGGVCLACHAATEEMGKPVVARLDALYPDDQARGFKAGDLRGAFSLREKVSE